MVGQYLTSISSEDPDGISCIWSQSGFTPSSSGWYQDLAPLPGARHDGSMTSALISCFFEFG